MTKKMSLLIPVFLLLLFTITANAFQEQVTSPQSIAANDSDNPDGLAAWAKAFEVFSHPRCANCHVEDGRPMWSGENYSKTEAHGMNIGGNPDNLFGEPGLYCNTCHMAENSPTPHGPPGAPIWHLPPKEMAWWGKSSTQVCEQLKDPVRNGERNLADIESHIAEDALVAWGWAPGEGRTPAPYSALQTAEFIRVWAQAGAPCPLPNDNGSSITVATSDVTSAQFSAQRPANDDQISPLLIGNIDAGKKAITVCKSCHTFTQNGANRVGPNLWNIVGADKAGVKGFKYSKAFQALEGEWTDEALDQFLKSPRKYAPGTTMVVGVRQDAKRADIIAYLKSLK